MTLAINSDIDLVTSRSSLHLIVLLLNSNILNMCDLEP